MAAADRDIPGLSAAQRRAVAEADPGTGRLAAAAATCTALRERGLAYRHPRSAAHYLTEAGRALRTRLLAPPGPPPGEPAPAAPEQPPGFAAATGHGDDPPAGPAREREVAAAWASLLEIRRLLNDGDRGRPAAWERGRPVHAVALALEAAGFPPARPGAAGYAVAESHQAVEVAWAAPPPEGPAAVLDACARTLAELGWQATRHTDRTGRAFLLVTAGRR